MLKIKYLHRSSRNSDRSYTCWKSRKRYLKGKNLNFLVDDLPFHEKMQKGYSNFDFTPLSEFIESKINEDWNDVYSEILTKIKKKFRYDIEKGIGGSDWCSWIIKSPIYDENFIPRDARGRMMVDTIYIDIDNIIRKKTKEEILKDSKKFIRRKKMQEILESQKKEQEENSDNIF